MVEVIWPLSMPSCPGENVLPLRTYIQEVLRRSRTSFSTLQVALYYLILIKAHVPKHDFTMEQPEDVQSLRALQCGRRMFLAALILASKYLQDRNFSAKAWSKISGLKVCEINTVEMAFLEAVNWKLHVAEATFERWQDIILTYTPSAHPPFSDTLQSRFTRSDWKTIIPHLTPELDTIDTALRPSYQHCHPDGASALSSSVSTPVAPYFPEPMPAPALKPPRFLEPKPDMLPPTPPLARMGPLPTPQMTPQPTVTSTPAAGLGMFESRRPSMCSAMAQAQSASITRCALDSWNPTPNMTGLEAYRFSNRRPSAVSPTPSGSSSSSPESMVSDNSNSSRSSRSSSISSASSTSSTIYNTTPTRLCKLATLRNACLPLPFSTNAQQQQPKDTAALDFTPEPLSAGSISSPDFDSFHIADADSTSVPLALRSRAPPSSASKSRKRGRSSADLSLQQAVRAQLARSDKADDLTPPFLAEGAVLPDACPAQSFLLRTSTAAFGSAKACQSPVAAVERRRPVARELGRKRACCAGGMMEAVRVEKGPGMWEGIL